MKNRVSYLIICIFLLLLNSPDITHAQNSFRERWDYKFNYRLRTIYFIQTKSPKFFKISEKHKIYYSLPSFGYEVKRGYINRIKADSIYIDGEGHRFFDLSYIRMPKGYSYNSADTSSWKVYFPPESAYKSPLSQHRYAEILLDTFRYIRFIKHMPDFYHNNIKFNITDIFILKAAISFEYRFTPFISWETELGYRFAGESTPPAVLRAFQVGQYQGPTLITGTKFCFKPGRFYLGPMLQAEYLEMHNCRSNFFNYGKDQLQDQYRYDIGLSLRGGMYTRLEHCIMDLYIGVGIKYVHIYGLDYGWYENDSDQTQYYNADKSPRIDNCNIYRPIVQFGMNIGFGF